MSSARSSTGVVAITNSQRTTMRLVLEPWADEHSIEPGATVEVAFSGPADGRMEVEVKDGEVFLYAWEGAVMSVPKP